MHACKSRLDQWLIRDLAALGGIYITKMESLWRCIYPAQSPTVSRSPLKLSLSWILITGKGIPTVEKRATSVKDYEDIGLLILVIEWLYQRKVKVVLSRNFLVSINSFWHSVSEEVSPVWSVELILCHLVISPSKQAQINCLCFIHRCRCEDFVQV